ncbi:uncharacterized protein LOC124120449 isoform X2 [Haliotis rufescens]|uniref:uncharacterized protein LOC124120449 isoform X2 n=1 Tax=Haliotis rufescens TaxID=6454 RepID=UPI00201F507E|nr:uncharacterized protein LOC124120449 isoform X2 [Haliotis rufescens]
MMTPTLNILLSVAAIYFVQRITDLPTCNISSDLDPLSLELGTDLSITVNIKNYSCSDQAGFDLTTGDVTETLLRNDKAALNTNEVLYSTVNVTLTRLGDVRLNFTCLDTSWELDCGGVRQLLKSPPSCNISSDVETDDLDLGTEVTLSVDIRNYYCSNQAEFNLTTGSAKEVLLARHGVEDISSAFPNTTFNATDERFGKVLVKFSCDNYNEDLICGGVKELVKNTSSLTDTTTTAGSPAQDPDVPVALIAGVCAGVLVLVVIVVVVVLNRRKITAVARKYIVTRKTQHSQFEDGLESSTSEPTLDIKDNVAFDEIKLDNVEKVADSEHE